MAGLSGPTGRSGAVGPQGATGQTGAQGVGGQTGLAGTVGPVGSWTPYKEYWFDSNRADLQSADASKAADIADYLTRNPSQQVGIDGLMDPNNTDLSNRRVSTVRNALLAAGVPAFKIQTGAFGNPQMQRDRRVEVLVSQR
jgi:outer membrane protein OmpA-like peptidoglycan-associated protein